ncbi:MtrAB system response regulator MtrA [Bifidobacterium sp. ESL0704]|uniref:MtrAB system response regulator MtrA n=1 Tax=Bifidobacterium sp. ESL0704 TaxID=2983219 RepID=UPI0032B0227E|nr:MtrAB system response regulator MtrA [Bifidobacterium sp. ESL0704]
MRVGSVRTPTIMVVDDDEALAEMLSIVLEDKGFRTVLCLDGSRAVDMFPTVKPDLILLDVMLPGMGGIDVAKHIRTLSGVPIIMLTAKTDTVDVVSGLEAGADDYVTKPFNTAELLARIAVRLRGLTDAPDATDIKRTPSHLRIGSIAIDRDGHTATKDGVDLKLTPVEFDLCFVLAANAGKAISRDELLKKVWGYEDSGDTRLVNVHIQRLRAKVESDMENPQVIQTVRGIGYRFALDDHSGSVVSDADHGHGPSN